MIFLTWDNPRPVPYFFVVKKGLKTCGSAASSIPAPLSMISTTACSSPASKPRPDGQGAAFRHGVDGVEIQVQECLLEHGRVEGHERDAVVELRLHHDLLFLHLPLRHGQRVFQAHVEIRQVHLRFRRLGEDEDVADEFLQVLHFLPGNVEALQVVARGVHPLLKDLEAHLDRGEGVSDLVGNTGRELSHGGKLLAFVETVFQLFEVRDVPLQDKETIRPLDGARRHEEIAFRAVLVDDLDLERLVDSLPDFIPALLQEFPSLRCDEFGEMPPFQFFGREPALGVDIAAHITHDPLGVEDED